MSEFNKSAVITHADCMPEPLFGIFKEELKQKLKPLLKKSCDITIRDYPKNNGARPGISFMPLTESGRASMSTGVPSDYLVSPVYYIDEFFAAYMDGELSIDNIASIIAHQYNSLRLPDLSLLRSINNPEKALSRICLRIMNTRLNRSIFENIPGISFLDLTLIFYYVGKIESRGFAGCIVSNELMESWNTDVPGLLRAAQSSAPGLLPPAIRNINEAIEGKPVPDSDFFNFDKTLIPIADNTLSQDPVSGIYILSNTVGAQGSAVILYRGVLKRCAEYIGGDFFILPSSVHEVLLMKAAPEIEPAKLRLIVQDINRTEVAKRDMLSDSVYRYYADEDSIGYADSDERISLGFLLGEAS